MKTIYSALLMVIGLSLASISLGSCGSIQKCLSNPAPSRACLAAQNAISCIESADGALALGYAEDDLRHGATEPEALAQLQNATFTAGACIAAALDAFMQTLPSSSSQPAIASRPSFLHDFMEMRGYKESIGKVSFKIKTAHGTEVRR